MIITSVTAEVLFSLMSFVILPSLLMLVFTVFVNNIDITWYNSV